MLTPKPKSQIQQIDPRHLEGFEDAGPLSQRIISLLNTNLAFTDIMIHQDSPIRVKRASGIFAVSDEDVSRELIEQLFSQLQENWQEKLSRRAFDRAVELSNSRIRVNCHSFRGGKMLGTVIRRFPAVPVELSELGLRPHAQDFTKLRNGLVLVIGDTCQGKSTTLASMLDEINKHRSGHILTIEDPVETLIPERKCLITQREVGEDADVASFDLGAQDALRQRADVVMIGEIRDPETAREAVALAESGPLVFASLHAKSPESGLAKLARLLGTGETNAQALSQVLKGVIYQVLLPSTTGDVYHLATETLTMNPDFVDAIGNMNFEKIRKLIETSEGCNSLNSDLQELSKAGKIFYEDAARVTTNKEKFALEVQRVR